MKKTDKKPTYVRSTVTEKIPGLTKGKTYELVNWGFGRGGAWLQIRNDRGELISIYNSVKDYLVPVEEKEKKS